MQKRKKEKSVREISPLCKEYKFIIGRPAFTIHIFRSALSKHGQTKPEIINQTDYELSAITDLLEVFEQVKE